LILLNVLVTDASYKHTLGIVRSLGSKGVEVTVVAESVRDLVCASRFCNRIETAPGPDQPAFAERILELASQHHFDLVMPVGYATTLALSRREADLCRLTRLEVMDYESIRAAGNKKCVFEIASAVGLNVPATLYPQNLPEVALYQSRLRYPLIIKPVCESPGVGVRRVDDAGQLLSLYREVVEQYDAHQLPMIQEYVPGYGCGFFALYQEGVCKRVFMHRRLRENPPGGGASCCAESFYDPKLKEYGLRLLDRLNWHGVAMVEFRYDTQARDYKLLEVNPKFWGSLDLALACGVDFPYLLCQMAEGIELAYSEQYEVGVRFHWPFSGDFQHCWRRPASFGAVLADCLNPRVRSNLWLSDFAPNLREAETILHSGWNHIFRR
jgi:predicted ATP-grasp superfamily ATP-dependent carboligase